MPFNDTDPNKDVARKAVYNAVRRGELERPSVCEACLEPRIVQAHHDDYDFPLRVKWLCIPCHSKTHHPFTLQNLLGKKRTLQAIEMEYS